MPQTVVVFCTCENGAQAESIAKALVQERLAACVNVLPPMRSIYRWQGKVEDANEVLLLIKSTEERFAALRDRILELHTYETPEVIALPITSGAEKYLAWIAAEV